MNSSCHRDIIEVEISSLTYLNHQIPITDNLIHYRNIFASPDNFIKRRVDYSKMKVFDEKFRKESERLASLQCLPIIYKDLLPLIARSGFFYKENPTEPDQVRCIYCQGNLSDWKKNDIPLKRHKYSYPTCPYIINLNVGNEPVEREFCKVPVEDSGVEKPKIKLEIFIQSSISDTMFDCLDRVENLDIDVREKTFFAKPELKYFAFRGFSFIEKESESFLKCSWCINEIPILNGIEKLGDELMHKKTCQYRNIEEIVIMEIAESSETSEEFCEVEYSLISQEVEARMEMRSITQILKTGYDREKLKLLLEHQLKTKGKDFESMFELLHELRRDINFQATVRSVREQDFALTEFQCVVCLDKPVEVVFLPCGHLKTCSVCSDLMSKCPVCRVQIEKRVKKFRFNSIPLL